MTSRREHGSAHRYGSEDPMHPSGLDWRTVVAVDARPRLKPDGGSVMTHSKSRMDELAERAEQARARVRASADAAKEGLAAQVAEARGAVEQTNQRLADKARDAHGEAQTGWNAARQSWQEHTAELRREAEAHKAEHDARRAERRAEGAEANAEAAIDFALLAIEDAEWAVLDAALKRLEADELAAAKA